MGEQDVQSLKPQTRSSDSSSLLKAAGVMSIAVLLSRVMGLVREQVFAILFGAGNLTDAFNVAFRIPNLLRDLFAEGAMSASLVPVFTRTRVQQGDRRAWRVAGLVFRILFVFVGCLCVLGILFAPQLVRLYASAFLNIPGKFELTVRMTQVMFPFFPLVALAAAFMGILNSCGAFFIPAFSSALFNVASILVGVACSQVFRYWGGPWGLQPIEGMAVGVVVGGAVQAFCQVPLLYQKGYRWMAKSEEDPVWYRDPALRQMLWMMVPGTVGLAATQVNLLVNTILATGQGPGAVSWLNYAFRMMQFPIGIFGVSFASATLPRVSRQWVEQDLAGVCATLTHSLRTVFAINLPASAGLAFLGVPIIELIFQYGRFSPSDTQATAFALAMYAAGLTAYSAVKILVPACYAMGNTRLPVFSSVLAVILTIILNLMMVGPFGYWGLALGTSLAAIFNAVFLLFSIKKQIESEAVKQGQKSLRFQLRSLLNALAAYGGISLAMGLLCYFSNALLLKICPDAYFFSRFGKMGIPFGRVLRVIFVVTEGVLMMMGMARIFKLKEATEILDLFSEKVKNKLSRKLT